MPRIAILQLPSWIDEWVDFHETIPQHLISNWEEVSEEELNILLEEAEERRENSVYRRSNHLDNFVVIQQVDSPRQFMENTVAAKLAEARELEAQRAAERERQRIIAEERAERKRANAAAAAERKRLAAEAKRREEEEKERQQYLALQKKFGKSLPQIEAGEQMSIL